MTTLVLHLTNAGLAAVEGASGSDPTVIAGVGLTATPFDMAPTLTALPGEFKRIAAVAGTEAAPNVTHMTAYDTSSDVWNATGFGLFLADGTLFAVYSAPTTIISKAGAAFALLAFDIAFSADLSANIAFGDPIFTSPPATTEVRGLVELATNDEAGAGVDTSRALTPAAAAASVLQWLLSRDGAGSGLDADLLDGQHGAWYADIAARLGYTPFNAAAFTPANVMGAVQVVDGGGSGLDADLLDGQHGAYYADIAARLGFTPLNAASLIVADDQIVFPGSLCVQWGKVRTPTGGNGGVTSVTLPHPLNAAPLLVLFAIYDPSRTYANTHLAQGDHTATTLTFRGVQDDDTDVSGVPGFDWLAVGRLA